MHKIPIQGAHRATATPPVGTGSSNNPAANATNTSSSTNASATAKTGVATTTSSGSSSGVTQSQFNEAVTRCNNCLYLIRRLRSQMTKMHDMVNSTNFAVRQNRNNAELHRKFEKLATDIRDTFEKLEQFARRLPRFIPPYESLNRMRTLYFQEHTSSQNYDKITLNMEKMIDAGNWNEGQYQIFHYLSELLRLNGHRKKISQLSKRPLPFSTSTVPATNGHYVFEQAYRGIKKEIAQKSLGIYPSVLLTSTTSMVIECKFGVAGPEKNDKNIVYTFKFLLVEKNGIVEFINIYAPMEDWHYDVDFSEKMLDPTRPSKHIVYEKLTKLANIHLLNSFGNSNRWTSSNLIQFITIFGKLRHVFDKKCRVCKKVLKDFLPPLIIDIRDPKYIYHESCY